MARPPASTRGERLRVRVLAGEGFTQREIAERIFGDERFRGRVERILKQSREPEPSFEDANDLVAHLETLASELKDADLPDLEELLSLYKRRSLQKHLDQAPETVRVSELAALLRLEIRLEQRRQYKRARDLTRQTEKTPRSEA